MLITYWFFVSIFIKIYFLLFFYVSPLLSFLSLSLCDKREIIFLIANYCYSQIKLNILVVISFNYFHLFAFSVHMWIWEYQSTFYKGVFCENVNRTVIVHFTSHCRLLSSGIKKKLQELKSWEYVNLSSDNYIIKKWTFWQLWRFMQSNVWYTNYIYCLTKF